MLASRFRFHRRKAIGYIHRRGQGVRAGALGARFVMTTNQQPRFAVVVSKKVDKRAAVRNRIRRRIYEQLRLLQPQMVENIDLVLTVFDVSVADEDATRLAARLRELLARSGAFR